MLIPDLLNTLFDQSDYLTLVMLVSLHKRKTTYANKYSLGGFYDIFDKCFIKNIEYVNMTGKFKMAKELQQSELHTGLCAMSGHVEMMKYIVSKKTCVVFDSEVIMSTNFGHTSMVKYLMSVPIYIYIRIDHFLAFAAGKGQLQIVQYLVKICANVNAVFDYDSCFVEAGQTTIGLAALNGHFEVVKYLVENGATIHDNNVLILGARGGNLNIVTYLKSVGSNLRENNDEALINAAAYGHLEVVKYLVDNGADIHAQNEQAFKLSSVCNKLEMVRYLVDMGADVHVDNECALANSIRCDNVELAKYLISVGANIHAIDEPVWGIICMINANASYFRKLK